MMRELIFLLQADHDIQTAFDRYDEYQEGRGEVFMRHLDAAFATCVSILRLLLSMGDVTGGC